MTGNEAAIQIKSLRAQLDVLEAKLRSSPAQKTNTFADPRGVVHAEPLTTDEEIDAARYKSAKPDAA